MPLVEAVLLALGSIRAQKLKSFFSLIGVLIGVTFLIAVVSIVQGMNVYMTDKFAGALIGVNTFQLRSRPNIVMGDVSEEQWRQWNRNPRITIADAAYIEEHMKTPARFARVGYDQLNIEWHGKIAKNIGVQTTDAEYFAIKHWDIEEGRAFSPQEVNVGAQVVVLGHELAAKLFDGRDPLGQTIMLGGLPHRVIGVVAPQGTLFGISLDKFAVTTLTSPVRNLVNRPHVIDDFHIQAENPDQMRAAMEEVTVLMRTRRGLRPSQPNTFYLESAEAALSEWEKISTDPVHGAPGTGGDFPGGRRHRDHEHHADGRGGADARDRHPQGTGGQASRHHGAICGRVGDPVGHRGWRRDRHRHPARVCGAGVHPVARRRGAVVDRGGRGTRGAGRHGGGRVSGATGRQDGPRGRPGARMSGNQRLLRGNLFARAYEGIALALGAMRASKMRASLTILGVAIGVMVVIAMASMITGIKDSVSDIIMQSGPNTFYVMRFFRAGIQISDGSDEMSPWRRRPQLTRAEAELIRRLPAISEVNVHESGASRVAYRDTDLGTVGVEGVDASWLRVEGGDMIEGRNFSPMEAAAGNYVVVINDKASETLFRHGEDPIGKVIKVFGLPFTIVGLYRDPAGLFQDGGGSPKIVVPHTTFVKAAEFDRGWINIAVFPRLDVSQAEAMDEVTIALRTHRGLKPAEENNFDIVTATSSWRRSTSSPAASSW